MYKQMVLLSKEEHQAWNSLLEKVNQCQESYEDKWSNPEEFFELYNSKIQKQINKNQEISQEKISSPYDSMKYISKRKLHSSLSKDKLLDSERKMQKEQKKSEELKMKIEEMKQQEILKFKQRMKIK